MRQFKFTFRFSNAYGVVTQAEETVRALDGQSATVAFFKGKSPRTRIISAEEI